MAYSLGDFWETRRQRGRRPLEGNAISGADDEKYE